MTVPRLETHNLTHAFDGRQVVRNISLSIAPGQVTSLLGPSGCGKSTTLRIIAGIERPDAGEVFLDGELVCGPSRHMPPEARGIGLMFQDFALFPHLSVGDNVAFGLRGPTREKGPIVEKMLQRVSMVSYANRYPHELSGGEQQRIALARALAPAPKVMLMDEPFSGLDNRLRDDIRDETLALLKEDGAGVLLVTHEPDEAMRMSDEIALMRGGRIIQQGAPYNLYNSPKDKEAAAFFSDIEVVAGTVKAALVQTAFGPFLTPGLQDGTEVEIAIRPQHIKIDFDRSGKGPNPPPQDGTPARGVVERARFMGKESLVEFRMDFNNTLLKATIPSVFLPKPGTVLWLMLRRDRCFVFPKT